MSQTTTQRPRFAPESTGLPAGFPLSINASLGEYLNVEAERIAMLRIAEIMAQQERVRSRAIRLSVEELAERHNITPDRVRKLTRRGQLVAERVTGTRRYYYQTGPADDAITAMRRADGELKGTRSGRRLTANKTKTKKAA